MGIDHIQVNFNETALLVMNIVIGFIMFGVALDLKLEDFKRTLKTRKPALIGLACQLFLLPAFTYLLVLMIQPRPSIALGLFLVAACPGGNLSNFLTHFAKGNTPLSISMSAISTVLAIITTPLNTVFWASLYGPTKEIINSFSINAIDMFTTIFFMLGLPLVLGMFVRQKMPGFAARFNQIMMKLSIVIFMLFIIIMLANNFSVFIKYVGAVVIIVMLHNATAIAIGYFTSRALKVAERDRRAIAIEVGIQNSGLGLVLIFNFFGGLGGMALVAAFWGIWHIISGLIIATFWSRRTPEELSVTPSEGVSA